MDKSLRDGDKDEKNQVAGGACETNRLYGRV